MQRSIRITAVRLFAVLLSAAILSCMLPMVTFAQAKPKASFSVAGGNYVANAEFPVTVYEDSGTTDINIVALELLYDATKLELVSVNAPPAGLMNFPSAPELKSGSVFLSRTSATFGVLNGKITVVTLNFRALTAAGTTALTIGPNSQIYDAATAENIWDGVITGATIAFAPAAPATNTQQRPQRSSNPTQPKATKSQQATSSVASEVKDAAVEQPVKVTVIGTSDAGKSMDIEIVTVITGVAAAGITVAALAMRRGRMRKYETVTKGRRHA